MSRLELAVLFVGLALGLGCGEPAARPLPVRASGSSPDGLTGSVPRPETFEAANPPALPRSGTARLLLRDATRPLRVGVGEGEIVVARASQSTADVVWRLETATSTPRTIELDLPLAGVGDERICWRAAGRDAPDRRPALVLARRSSGPSVEVEVEVESSATDRARACALAAEAWVRAEVSEGAARRAALATAATSADRAEWPELAASARLARAEDSLDFEELARRTAGEGSDGSAVRAAFGDALAVAEAAGERLGLWTRLEIGEQLRRNGLGAAAERWLVEVLSDADRSRDSVAAARASHALGLLAAAQAQIPVASARFEQARSRWRPADRLEHAASTNQLATFRVMEKRMPAARLLLEDVLTSIPFGPDGLRCEALAYLGWVYVMSDEPSTAVPIFEHGLEQCDRGPRSRVGFLDRLASALRALGDFDRAEALYLEALESSDSPLWRGHIQISLADLTLERDRVDEARVWIELAIRDLRGRDPNALAHALALAGRVEWADGALDAAQRLLTEATDVADSLWLESYRRGALARATALVQDIDQLYVELTMALADDFDDPALVRAAFRRSDFARARNLVARLGAAAADRPPSLEDVDAAIERLPPGSVLLSFALGERASHVFVVDADGLHSRRLASRDELEGLALPWIESLRASPLRGASRQREALGAQLAELLLEPVAPLVASSRRWVVVADGLLARLPFAALPDGRGGALLDEVEIVHGPSLASLARIEARPDPWETSPQAAAVAVADPVYGRHDSRCRRCTDLFADEPGSRFERLEGTGSEATILRGLVPGTTVLSGFEATRRAVLEGGFRKATIVHIGAHTAIDPVAPERSALMLTRFDPTGRRIPGALRLDEIRRLELDARLVVLSACRTAWDEGVRGDSLEGFAQAFLLAGASRVVVSLWDVDDRDTVEMMDAFYERLTEGDPPARALREAQADVRRRPGLDRPSVWAPWRIVGPIDD